MVMMTYEMNFAYSIHVFVCVYGCRSLLATSGVFGPLLILLVTQLLTSALSPLSGEASLSTADTAMTTDSRQVHEPQDQEQSTEVAADQVDVVVVSDNSQSRKSGDGGGTAAACGTSSSR